MHNKMTTIQDKEVNYQIQLKNIEILKCSIEMPGNIQEINGLFNFNINIESKADANKNLIFVLVHITVVNDNKLVTLANLSVSCIYEINNFNELVKIDENGKMNIPQNLIETLNIISISTTRGVMFSSFKGTFLHNAILPIIDPKQLHTSQVGNL
jgi:hypothetical protein